jgi:RNA polymerase sigma-70 factor (ECF subfamily)
MSDLALARRVLAGEEAAFEELFHGYGPRLYRFALVRLRANEDLAEEVVQRVLIRAIDRLHTYRGEAALFTWLCTLCRREIAACLEGSGVSAVSLSDERIDVRAALEALAATEADNPEAALGRQEIARVVHATLDHLPGRYGDVLEWRYVDGLSVDEIAMRLHLTYKAAESQLSRARAAFRTGYEFVMGSWSGHRRGRRTVPQEAQ